MGWVCRAWVITTLLLATGARAYADDAPFRCKPDAKGCLDGEVIGVMFAIDYDYTVVGVQQKPRRNDNPVVSFATGDIERQPTFDDPNGPIETTLIGGDGKELSVKTHEAHLEWAPIERNAELVRVRVNLGRGSAPDQREFHADKIESLDGTKAYPLNLSKLVNATLASFESPRTTAGAHWRTAASKAARAASTADAASLKTYKSATETIAPSVSVTWLADKNAVRVRFAATLERAYSKRVPNPRKGTHAVCIDPPACSRNIDPPMSPYVVQSRTYAAHYTIDVLFDAAGKKLSSSESPIVVDPAKDDTIDPS